MKTLKLKKALKTSIFTYEEIAYLLKDEVSNVNAKIAYMVKQGILVRLKKGLYIFSELYRDGSVDMVAVANRLYAPSYISFDYALSYYGLIPERVYEITSATLHAKKTYETHLGREKMREYLLYDLRIEWEALLELDIELVEEIAKRYKSYNLKSLSSLLKRNKNV